MNSIDLVAGHCVYLVEDDAAVRLGCSQALSLAGIDVREFEDAESAFAALSGQTPAAIVSDIRLPGIDGLALLESVRARARDADIPVVLVTGHGDIAMAVTAMRAGAYDFIEKPFHSDRLVESVRRALAHRRLVVDNRSLRAQLHGARAMLGRSPAIERVRALVAAIGPTPADVLIRGETGSGKEVLARALHDASRREGPFVAVNCAALPESLFESEIFGHEPGAFTGAQQKRIGKFEHADRGTLFLDELENLSLALQAKLLRVLQERTVERLGSNTPFAVDVRVIAAIKEDLKTLVERGDFRADLYYRLNVATIDLPPLRERRDDIPELFMHFVRDAAARYGRPEPECTPADMARWRMHDWPGNVRELKNVAERFCLGLDDGLPQPEADDAHSLEAQMARAERAFIEEALGAAQGQVQRAAELLGLPRKTLYDKIARHGIDMGPFRSRPA
ncbi:sigma-54 dependent transcriptional regulator [Trinickia caryophylli]|uniref:Two-component system, NtrC family, C4-dicarboxylate transport response regulator DctD n=1 Tax=Trinickia caryophylli TaxID=28094 RepID=A0A1X7H966_TRICW|nr:sigma-54 dependent transcriptional regulator [Trinickia caryophylli]PMS09016.1 sigma-54-dependent Fis family transcriptional regulator [Trinickia caryophylli]TRX14847.1 sigma-54-dependent Fis family transcriptional regulator [Trinickia caryophylli]WQE14694.1 sigma-54 dependent transcriptional regulator [Trinickia caryophylli]SMF81927.1 two-component system, NtrC family, C4-dicarboxylate transport response regulator DctD [Trinickia caryophylli]GLU31878.1 sigma-54-dependent Fis family transcr